MSSETIILLGSNTDRTLLTEAVAFLGHDFEIKVCSGIAETAAVGSHYLSRFYNQAILLHSLHNRDESVCIFKETEKKLGRTPQSKHQGIVPMDIDLIVWNGEVCHGDYFRFDFVRACVDEIWVKE